MRPVLPQVIHIQLPNAPHINAGTSGMGNIVKNLFHLELAKMSASPSQTETSNMHAQANTGVARAGVFIPASTNSLALSGSNQGANNKSKNKTNTRKTPALSSQK